MDNKIITTIVLIACSAILIFWDIYVAIRPPSGDTISEIILSVATKHPVLPFALGFLMGHLLWSQTIR